MTTDGPAPPEDVLGQLQQRITTLEIDVFGMAEQLRHVRDSADRTASALDDIEDVLTDLADTARPGAPPVADAMSDLGNRPAAPGTSPAIELPDLAALYAWVDIHLAPMVRRTTTTGEGGGVRWCRQWWDHDEAVQRFTALYLTHTELSASGEPTWLSVYLRDHLDPHLALLTSPYGPFYACSPRKHSTAVEPLGQLEHHAATAAAATTGGLHDQHDQPEPRAH